MRRKVAKSKVVKVFNDVKAHRLMTDLIIKHSTNKNDVREIAVRNLNLEHCKNVLDLGCGYGFFTEKMKGKLDPRAVVTGVDLISSYEKPFLENCANAGFRGRFFSGSATLIKKFAVRSFDLILCSYALYFFPDLIPSIARISTDDGTFVVITHDRDNMKELVYVAKDVLAKNDILKKERLPIEKIINEFSSENGQGMLIQNFRCVTAIDYLNNLVFQPGESEALKEYFLFKSPFLLIETDDDMKRLVQLLLRELQQNASFLKDGFSISKNDRIFISTLPLRGAA